MDVFIEESILNWDKSWTNPVFQLLDGLCGLKQAFRILYEETTGELTGVGLKNPKINLCLIMKHNEGRKMVATIYVDDIVLAGYPKYQLQETGTFEGIY